MRSKHARTATRIARGRAEVTSRAVTGGTLPRVVALVIALALPALAACGGGSGHGDAARTDSGAGGQVRDHFTLAIAWEMGPVDPHYAGVEYMHGLMTHNVYQTLTEPNFKGSTVKPAPVLATSWKRIGDNRWQFKLREGVTFANGEPFDANAVKFSMDRYNGPKQTLTHLATVRSTKVIDSHTVEFTTTGPDPVLPLKLILLPIVPPKLMQDDPAALLRKPVGTGPYIVESASTSKVELSLNPNYWNKANSHPIAQRVTVIRNGDPGGRLAGVLANQFDAAMDLTPEQARQAPKVQAVPANETLQLKLNAVNGPFSSPKLREAVRIGTDTEQIRKQLYGDEYSTSPGCQLPPPSSFGYDPSLTAAPLDVARAKALVAESGYHGEPIQIAVPAGHYAGGEDFAAAVAAQWKALGLNVSTKTVPSQPWLDAIMTDGADVSAVEVSLSAFTMDGLGPITTGVLPEPSGGADVESFPHKEYPQVKPLVDKAANELDTAQRESDIHELSKMICDSGAFLFLANIKWLTGVQDDVAQPLQRPDQRVFLDE